MEVYLKRHTDDRRRETKEILENSSDLDQFAKDVFSRLVLANEQNQEGMSDLELVCLETQLEGIRADVVCLARKCKHTRYLAPQCLVILTIIGIYYTHGGS